MDGCLAVKHLDDSCPAQAQTPSRFRPVLYFVGVKHGLELVSTGLPFIDSANQRVNIMMQQNKAGEIVISVCDPHIGLPKTTG